MATILTCKINDFIPYKMKKTTRNQLPIATWEPTALQRVGLKSSGVLQVVTMTDVVVEIATGI